MPSYYTWSRSRLLQVYSSQAAADAAAAAGSIPVGQPVAVNGGNLVGMVVAGPSIQWNTPPSNTYTSVAGGYAAVLAHARANASDGDVYLDADSGVFFVFYKPAGTYGLLIEPEDHDAATGYEEDAGPAECALGDAEADLLDKGFVLNEGTGASASKAAGAALLLDSGTANGQAANPVFAPTGGGGAKSLIVARFRLAKVNTNNSGSPLYVTTNNGAQYGRLEHNTSAGDGRGRWWSGSAQLGGGIITNGVGNWRTQFLRLDGSGADGSWRVRCLETGEVISAQRSQLLTATSGVLSWQCYNAGGGVGGQTQHEIEELHWISLA